MILLSSKVIKNLLYLFILFSILILFNCRDGNQCPKVTKGIIDYTNWDFEKNGNCNMDGEWEFYLKEFLTLSQIIELPNDKIEYISVPNSWNSHLINGEKLDGKNYATYRIKIILGGHNSNLGLRNLYVSTSYKLFIDEKELIEVGKIGKSQESYKPKTNILLLELPSNKQEINLIIQVANFQHNKGGIRRSFRIGLYTELNKERVRFTSIDLLLSGSLLIMGLYHIFIYILRRDIKANIYFGLFCFLMFLRILFVGEIFINTIFPDLPYDLMTRIEYLSIYMGLPIFIMYIFHSFEKYISKSIIYITFILNLPFNLLVFFGDIYLITKTLFIYEIYLIITIFVTTSFLISLVVRKEYDATYLLISGTLFAICILNDILHNLNLINSTYTASYGFFIVIFSQSILISVRYTNALKESEDARKYLISKEMDLLKSKNEVERLSHAKDIFLSNLSHEVKTPLSYIYGYSELLNEYIKDGNERDYISVIYTNSKKLNDYISDLILLTEIDIQIKLNYSNTRFSHIINEIFLYYSAFIEEKALSIMIEIKEDHEVNVDPMFFGKAISNIIKNSIIYNKKEGFVSVNANKKDHKTYINIIDSGVGIKENELPKIFNKFYRIDSDQIYETQGVGVGLYIAEKIINLHGGEIQVQSKINVGSTFTIII